MKEEAQGFLTAWGSMGFPLRPKALGVSEKVKQLGKSKLTTSRGHFRFLSFFYRANRNEVNGLRVNIGNSKNFAKIWGRNSQNP